jgi:CRISPR-associated exonuclease Cas4
VTATDADAVVVPLWRDEELILISALEHWSYCPRQCALIHLEQTYDENIYTLRGNRAHERAHEESVQTEDGVRVTRGLPLWSDLLGLIGKADVVEWHGETPFPVEYKVGKKRNWGHEVLQLCAQAICLEEMLGVAVSGGAIYYVGSKRRRAVVFTQEDRETVRAATVAVRAILAGDRLPVAIDDARCPKCSLIDACTPGIASRPAVIRGYYAELFHPHEP